MMTILPHLIALLLLLLCAACGTATEAPPTPPPLTRIIDFWQPVSGSLNAGETQAWKFIGALGDQVRARAISTMDGVALALVAPDGRTLSQGQEVEAILPLAGTYTITITSTASGDYELGLGYANRPNPADYTPTPLPATVSVPTPTPPYYAQLGTFISTISGGQTLPGELGANERHVYTFEGQAATYININLRHLFGEVDPRLALYAPSGNVVAEDDNSGTNGGAILRNIRLPEDGTYSILAAGDGFSGAYEVTLFTSSQPAPITPTVVIVPTMTPIAEVLTPTIAPAISETLSDYVPVSGVIERPGDVNRFVVYAAAGETFTLGVSPAGSPLRPHIELYDPDGLLVATATVGNSNASGDALISAYRAALTGAYVAFVTGENGSTGSYVISYGLGVAREDVRRGETLADRQYGGEVIRRGLRDRWSLFLRAGDIISAAVTPNDAQFDPTLEFAAPDGSLIAHDENSGGGRAALIDFALAPVDGLYSLRVVGAGGFGSGPYTLIWRYINRAATPTPPPGTVLIASFGDTIAPETYQFYRFQGAAGEQVRIQVIAEPGSSLDPVAALLGVDGTVIAEGDDSGGDLNARFTATLPADGTYTVRVNGYLSSGAFTLTIERLY